MRCKEYEYLIIESTERDLTDTEQLRLKQHCSRCESCSHFKENIEEIHFSLKRSDPPALPADLDKHTKDLCLDEMNRKRSAPGTNKDLSGRRYLVISGQFLPCLPF